MSYSFPVPSTLVAPIRKFKDKDGKEPKRGDLIQIFRRLYQHWAVYVGGGDVVHFKPAGRDGGDIACHGKGQVLKENWEDVVENDKWRVKNRLDKKYRPRPANEIVEDACSMLDEEPEYNLVKYNCEHFANEMRYGKPKSRQVKAATAGITAALLAIVQITLTILGYFKQGKGRRSRALVDSIVHDQSLAGFP
ncbi:phospholipase A and acyltransferase 3-like [Cololabis saira]|uniref:phospholipase A and acyltransferase 3-like n=1 Tax=Cololabis saira TaxID=129043 RepID=UPI002AD46936|nr:phospholipase A and acyltransferase 3-like [Cololabis saira]